MQSFRKKVYLGVAFLLILNLTFLSWLEPIYADTTGETETSLVQEQVKIGDASQEANGTSEEAVPVEAVEKTEAEVETEAGTDAVSEGNALFTSTPQGENEETSAERVEIPSEAYGEQEYPFFIEVKLRFFENNQGQDDRLFRDVSQDIFNFRLTASYQRPDGTTIEKEFQPSLMGMESVFFNFPRKVDDAKLIESSIQDHFNGQARDLAEIYPDNPEILNHFTGQLILKKEGEDYIAHFSFEKYARDVIVHADFKENDAETYMHYLEEKPKLAVFEAQEPHRILSVWEFREGAPSLLFSTGLFSVVKMDSTEEQSGALWYGKLLDRRDEVEVGKPLPKNLLEKDTVTIGQRVFQDVGPEDNMTAVEEFPLTINLSRWREASFSLIKKTPDKDEKKIHLVKRWLNRHYMVPHGPTFAIDIGAWGVVDENDTRTETDENQVLLPDVPFEKIRVYLLQGHRTSYWDQEGEDFSYTGHFVDLEKANHWQGDISVDSFIDEQTGWPYNFKLLEADPSEVLSAAEINERARYIQAGKDYRSPILGTDVILGSSLFYSFSSVYNDLGVIYNSYSAHLFSLPVRKKLEGRALQDGEFSFGLSLEKKTRPPLPQSLYDEGILKGHPEDLIEVSAEEKEKNTFQAKNNVQGEILFEPLRFKTPGRYQYRLWEVLPETKDPQIRYDEGQKLVTIEVKENADGLFTAQLLTDEPIVFVNRFLGKEEPETPSGGKDPKPSPGGGGGHSNLNPPSEGIHSESPELQLKPIVKEEAEKLIEKQPEVKDEPAPTPHPVSSVVPAQTRLPQTGEGRNPEFYAGVLALLGLGCLAIGFWRRRRSED